MPSPRPRCKPVRPAAVRPVTGGDRVLTEIRTEAERYRLWRLGQMYELESRSLSYFSRGGVVWLVDRIAGVAEGANDDSIVVTRR